MDTTTPSAARADRPRRPDGTSDQADRADNEPEFGGAVLARLGHWSASHPARVVAAWMLGVLLLLVAGSAWGGELDAGNRLPGSESQQAADLFADTFPLGSGIDATVVLATGDDAVIDDYVTGVRDVPGLTDVGVPVTSPNGDVTGIQLTFDADIERATLDALVDLGADFDARSVSVGHSGDLLETFEPEESMRAELIGLLAAAGIILIAFGSILAMAIPIGTALIAVTAGLAIGELLAASWPVPEWAPLLGSMIGIGVGIDYSLFLVARHREHTAGGGEPIESAAHATTTAGRSVLFAGGTVVVSILGLAIAGLPIVTAAAATTSIIVLVVVAAALTLVPALLGLFGNALERFRLPGLAAPSSDGISPGWQRWVTAVCRRPIVSTCAALAAIAVLTAPAAALDLAFPNDTVLSEDRTERIAYDLLTDGFGEGANTRYVAIIASAPGQLDATVLDVSTTMAGTDGVGTVLDAEINPTGNAAIITAFGTSSPADPATAAGLDQLRAGIDALELPAETQVLIGGPTAGELDLADRLADRTPWIIAAVAMLSFVLLVLLFRSILVPLKAAVLNLLSVVAAYGAIVAVFQWGWLADVFNVEATGPINPLVPMFMFAVLFGLSMDYEVFLLSRVKEHHQRSGDTNQAVIAGLSSTARIITSAALIMVSVFAGFIYASDPIIKTLALGLAVAIAVDATIVRTILVPATMRLLGERNWWLPNWLDRALPDPDSHRSEPPDQATGAAAQAAQQRRSGPAT